MGLSDTQRRVLGLLNEGYTMIHLEAWGDSLDHKTWMRRVGSEEKSIHIRYPTYESLLLHGYLQTVVEDWSGCRYTLSEEGRKALEAQE